MFETYGNDCSRFCFSRMIWAYFRGSHNGQVSIKKLFGWILYFYTTLLLFLHSTVFQYSILERLEYFNEEKWSKSQQKTKYYGLKMNRRMFILTEFASSRNGIQMVYWNETLPSKGCLSWQRVPRKRDPVKGCLSLHIILCLGMGAWKWVPVKRCLQLEKRELCKGVPGKKCLAKGAWQRSPGKGCLAKGAWQRVPEKRCLAKGAWKKVPGKGCLAKVSWQRVPG